MPMSDPEGKRLCELVLAEFCQVLRELRAPEWGPTCGHPTERGYIEQTTFHQEPWRGKPQRAWRVTAEAVEALEGIPGLPTPRVVRGMFFDVLWGQFGLSEDRRRVAIHWQTGPRFGRGFLHLVQRGPNGAVWLGQGEMIWVS